MHDTIFMFQFMCLRQITKYSKNKMWLMIIFLEICGLSSPVRKLNINYVYTCTF